MRVARSDGGLKSFRRTAWRFQATFHTPLKDLRKFSEVIVSSVEDMAGGDATVESVIFEPKHLMEFTSRNSLRQSYGRDTLFHADGADEARELLVVMLSDWIDFLFVPTPRPFVVYADHDEHITFFSQTRSNLNRVVRALTDTGYAKVEGYERQL